VFSANTVFDNTFLFIPKDSLRLFGFKNIINDIIHETQFTTHFDPNYPNRLYHVILSNEVLGPSFMVNLRNNSSIGVTTAARYYTNINNITGHFGQNAFAFLQEQDLWNTTFHDNSARLNTMGWLEYGLNYAAVIYKNGRNEFKGGITLKYLQGIAAGYFKNTNLTYKIINNTEFNFSNTSIDYGRTDYNLLMNSNSISDLIHGYGFGGNIGLTYLRLKNFSIPVNKTEDQSENNYIYRIGVSLIDVGSINFNKNAADYHLQAVTANYSNWKQSHIANNTQLDKTLSAVFYHDSTASLKADHFTMGLPVALSLQADWNFYKNFFVNATIIKNLGRKNSTAVVSPDVYSLTPRYETEKFELSMPVSLLYYGHWQPRIGLAARAGCFFIGGDALGGLLKLNDFEGAEFYMGVHFFVTKEKFKPINNESK
jgi:hypothetical protein